MDMRDEWLRGLRAWAEANRNVRELWLFGSHADGTSGPESDVDIGIGLTPPTTHDWARGNYERFGDEWQRELAAIVGCRVSLEPITPDAPGTARVRKWELLFKRG